MPTPARRQSGYHAASVVLRSSAEEFSSSVSHYPFQGNCICSFASTESDGFHALFAKADPQDERLKLSIICLWRSRQQCLISGNGNATPNVRIVGALLRGSISIFQVVHGPTLRRAAHYQISVCSANSKASSISTPRYRTVFSILVWPSRIWIARRLPVAL
jgi:hypothetical protein